MVAGFAKLAKGAGLKILSRRSSRVRIPYPALNLFLMAILLKLPLIVLMSR